MANEKSSRSNNVRATSGVLIRHYREQRGWSQKELASRMAIPAPVLSALETGGWPVTEKTRISASAALEIHPDDLMEGRPKRDKVACAIIDIVDKMTADQKADILGDLIKRL